MNSNRYQTRSRKIWKMNDYEKVYHPTHYNWIPGVECIDIIEWMSFNLGNAVKYIWRVGNKPNEDPEIELRKAIFYLEREISRLQQEDMKDE